MIKFRKSNGVVKWDVVASWWESDMQQRLVYVEA